MHRRRTKVSVGSDGVPVPLTDENDPVWATPAATEAFLGELGLTIDHRQLKIGPITRCVRVGEAWAWQAGITRAVDWGISKTALDLARMRELGLRAGYGGNARERFKSIEFRTPNTS